MPSGKVHTKINTALWVITLLLFAKYHTLLNGIFLIGSWDNYLLPLLHEYHIETFFFNYLAGVWFVLYSLDFYIHTIYLNPDLDTASDATHKLKALGKLIDWIFPHRGPTHSIMIWILIFVPLCWFVGSFCIGGFLAGICHILCDGVQTHIKRSWAYKRVKKSWFLRIARKVF